ncbi:hypothetical protein, variant 3 [Exophiala oligosperma]|uniref:Uncharacterized protein n=1 Tax=Exophiala oligosperma TaxID=215243 RepID=A0A0D2DAK2_9EURO|nr:uncharacterized protein PV06_08061 [Exophiala oligosperma]XP_016259664.1 hypothetical protein, variant 1 [Exophiala oligosperma]XP_016259665.1 hypothetical protein, variant 2 [Exophiala oligosperma]XP_016259666.1 hypothetical protein, variant 3 [Exophiala oligosperma]KIW39447.1 hypothetical protein PV06_08061 [Exophiala oligosperma]KIW39448.1 hypothetical protein, variant 1 [Exophiala oligosperma]KIW39449.1 hypothetical protein, variant 2 [Exophiala oligosperma]KIW39450.1 hypothetical pro
MIEVANSQKVIDLRRIAQDYTLGSDIKIRVVIGIDLEYKKHKRTTLTVWRANDEAWAVEPTILDQSFRLDDGQPVNDTTLGIRLRLAEFGDSTQDNGIEGEIFVSYKELYECLQEPEDCIESEKLEARERHQNNFTEADEAVYTEA